MANMDEPCIVTEQLVVRLYNTDVGSFGFVNLHGAKITLRDDDEKLVHLTWSPPPASSPNMRPVLMVTYDESEEDDCNNGKVEHAFFCRWMPSGEWDEIVEVNGLSASDSE